MTINQFARLDKHSDAIQRSSRKDSSLPELLTVDDAAVEAKKDSLIHDIETALLSKDLARLRSVKERITKMRRAGLERAGEWSTENLAFKVIRNLGLIDVVAEKIRELEDQELSLEQTQQLD